MTFVSVNMPFVIIIKKLSKKGVDMPEHKPNPRGMGFIPMVDDR
jgi:hypothetical protein